MKSSPSKSTLAQTFCPVKPPDLPSNYDELVAMRYQHRQGEVAVSKLAQGEIDILEQARQSLGWHSIYSLAYKWYPLYPYRKCWQRALEKCSQERIQSKLRTPTLNLKYLLLAVITKVQESLRKSYSANRLTHLFNKNKKEANNRLTQPSEVSRNRFSPPDPDKYIKGRYGHMVKR